MLFNRTRPLVSNIIELKKGHPGEWCHLGRNAESILGTKVDNEHCLDQSLKETISCKYADYDYAYSMCNNDLVRYILHNAPVEGKHERLVVDIKIHEIKEGQYACIPGWHLDGSIGLEQKSELHHLFVGSTHALTEFVDVPLELEVDPNWNFAQRSSKIGAILDGMDLPVFAIPNCQYVTYDNSFFHRGKCSSGNEIRLLVRVTETDVIMPQNRVFTPDTY